MRPSTRLGVALWLATPALGAAQGEAAGAPPTARAVRTPQAIVLDGRDDDAVWRTAPVSDEFYQFTPAEAVPARLRTAFQVAYDDRTLYVFVRMFDPRPDSIVALLSRRDVKTPSEWIKVVVDAFHDRRSAAQFMVNPAGVKRDASIYNDISEDNAWDGVWDVAVTTDNLGWTAEFAIPFSQLRFAPKDAHTFGFGVWRDVARHAERDAWPVYRPSFATFASQLGDLVGIEGIGRNRRLEIMPYTVVRQGTVAADRSHPVERSVGLDFKAGLTSNITVDATINPDFGQVEADPAVLNLSAFEIRFEERRPFFQEGVNLFRCNGPCEGVFYTRRVGRAPQLSTDATDPDVTTIQAAAKITGRTSGGAQFGVVAVSSAEERGASGTIEPQTTSLVGRLVQDFRGGRSQFGGMVTGLARDADPFTDAFLRREAYTLLFQGYHRFADRWEFSGYAGRSLVLGSATSIAATQRSSVHYNQRPDHEVPYDSTRTRLDGGVYSFTIRRYAGRARWETTTRYAEPGTELNDLGFGTLFNDVMLRNVLVLSALRPGTFHRRASGSVFTEGHWSTGGLPTGTLVQLSGFAEFPNFWSASLTYAASQFGASHCVSCARGGPALRVSTSHVLRASLDGDARRALAPAFDYSVSTGDEGRSWSAQVGAGIVGRVGARTSFELSAGKEERASDTQWAGNFGAFLSDTTHYTFARLRQTVFDLTARANVTVSPTLSVQLYAQPFVASGAYNDWREMVDARAPEYAARFAPYGGGASPAGFNAKSFNSNAVVRWEYRPGSVLFVVWQQGRSDGRDPGSFDAGRDLANLFRTLPDNTLLVKMSYWFNP